jgi:hypothetical protein
MFAEVNEVICHLKLAEDNGYQFVIDWRKSPYRDERMIGDPWSYFFNDCFDTSRPNLSDEVPYLGDSTDGQINFMRPRVYPNLARGPMLLPTNRNLAHQLIGKYIRPKEEIRCAIERFRQEHFRGYTIGLHLRGPGRRHGGTQQLRKRHTLKNGVPFHLYFRCVDQLLRLHPEARVFVCSDSEMVIDECRCAYGKKILTYGSIRSSVGEMHQQAGKYSGYRLGMDVIIEAYLLSQTDYLVHGNSNVSNFVLCLNPVLEAKYVYDADPHTNFALGVLDRLLGTRIVRKVRSKIPAPTMETIRRPLGL